MAWDTDAAPVCGSDARDAECLSEALALAGNGTTECVGRWRSRQFQAITRGDRRGKATLEAQGREVVGRLLLAISSYSPSPSSLFVLAEVRRRFPGERD